LPAKVRPVAPTPAESALADEWKSANEGRIRPLCAKASKNAAGTLEIRPDHPGGDMVWAALLMRWMGTKNEQAAQGLLNALTNAAVSGGSSRPSEPDLNGALSMLQEIAPRDEIEAMLVSQVIATHAAIASQARMLHGAEIPQLGAIGSLLTKLGFDFVSRNAGLGKRPAYAAHVGGRGEEVAPPSEQTL
jgi:hypothetical protein